MASPLLFLLFAVGHPLVHLNAALNSVAAVLLVAGFVLIKQGRQRAHGRVMLTAFVVSCLFLISYSTYHILEGRVEFTHPGAIRSVYLTILATHIALAATVPFLAVTTIAFALLGTGYWGSTLSLEKRGLWLVRHRMLARWTLPIWLYVSVTGVVVYVMLYHLWPPVVN